MAHPGRAAPAPALARSLPPLPVPVRSLPPCVRAAARGTFVSAGAGAGAGACRAVATRGAACLDFAVPVASPPALRSVDVGGGAWSQAQVQAQEQPLAGLGAGLLVPRCALGAGSAAWVAGAWDATHVLRARVGVCTGAGAGAGGAAARWGAGPLGSQQEGFGCTSAVGVGVGGGADVSMGGEGAGTGAGAVGGPMEAMNRNARKPKKANKGARPCSSVMRRLRKRLKKKRKP